ncbi:acyltransferase domain-containing protein [Actinomadura chibensis]|uniref:[acyl-carrier-protein] S-malonyltransferase n=1 Tax=Actinomadura chibensis TaxID=392828 RepID=A0A5D0NA48_9ACTN|nr:acyltransferase domain-containing protein [Actinomadura chibensis]TYB41344.1 acyltransferase domain-containing protein [Actinomadura chibensis]
MPSSEFRPAEELKPDDTCAFLFAGTGAAGVPDLPALARTGPGAARAVADVLDAVQEGLPPTGWPSLRTILLDEPAAYRPAARAPGVAQLASYAVAVAVDRALRAHGVHPAFAVGQSFGEIAALVCAGAFTITDGARMAVSAVDVLARRGRGGGMGLLEAGEDDARAFVRAAGEPDVVVACLNAPSATVVSGPDGPLEAVLAAARARGVGAVRLAVPYLSHHPALTGADDEWYAMIRRFPQRPLRVAVHSPVRGRAYRDDDDLHRALADCVVQPVRLPDTLRAVHAAGATVFAEAGAGAALCQCARLCVPGARTLTPLRDRPRPGVTGKAAPGVAAGGVPPVTPKPPPGTVPDTVSGAGSGDAVSGLAGEGGRR